MVARFGYLVNKWTVTAVAALALMAVVLATALPAWAQNDNGFERDYAENGTDPVATFTAVDPEGRTVYWSLWPDDSTDLDIDNDGTDDIGLGDDADQDYFSISMDGVLNFKFPPDAEMPRGIAFAAGNNNTYNVVVVSSDGALGAGMTTMPIRMAYHKVIVTVTDEDDDGSVSLSALQPQQGVNLTATLMDDDAPDSDTDATGKQIDTVWKWEQSSAMVGPWTLISGETDALYMPAKDVAGMYLRVTATYDDEHGDDKTVMAVSARPARAKPTGTNSPPSFPNTNAAQTREVDENSPPGTAVGKPVKASDTAGEILTYTLNGIDESSFDINPATGQIMVGARTTLDEETKASYSVDVTATDPSAEETATAVTVTINVKDVNEAPSITGGPTRINHAEGSTAIDLDAGTAETQAPTYTATDQESTAISPADECDHESGGSTCSWKLNGPDAGDLEISNEPDNTFGQLSFKKVPNYEMPADSNGDNTYMVTVVATDAGVDSKNKMTAERAVVITVKNVNEDGMVAYSSVQPKVRIPFAASLTDPDGMTTDVKWQWWKTTSTTETAAPAFPAAVGEGTRTGWDEIDDAETDTYTPVSGDIGRWLAAVATYTDPIGPGQIAESTTASNDVRSANAVDENKDNVAPEFREGGKKPVMQATRYVLETAAAGGSVVVNSDGNTAETTDPVAATDPNDREGIDTDDSEGILTYTLGGRGGDKDSFAIAQDTGQITVGADTKLDYESNKKSYMVTVTAADPSQAMTTIDVTIMVVDADEAPEFTGSFAGDEPFTGTIREENTNLRVATLTASSRDKGQPKVYWSLKEDGDYTDDDHFQIDGNGVLSFKSSPDYENPRGAALAADSNNNTYKVIVVASDDAPGANGTADAASGQMADKKVEITVTEIEEDGVVNLSARYAQVGIGITATLTDDDVVDATGAIIGAASLSWQWYKGNSGTTEAEGQNDGTATLTPDANDAGTVRAVASYTDAGGEPRTVSKTVNVRTVPADQDASPTFLTGSNARTVKENMRADTDVGSPVKAQDDDTADNTKLTYDLTNDGDGNFKINPANGQLTTTRMLNREGTDAAAGGGSSHTVTVTATDPGGTAGTQAVVITVENVNEGPMITVGETRQDYAEKLQADTLTAVDTYMASDPETTDDDNLVWSLTGPDASDFNIGNQEGATTLGELTFKEKPDFEKPVDANKDNVYMVTVKVTDDGKSTGTRQMVVTVTNVSEDGAVKLSAIQPKTGIGFMASLTDPDFITSTNTDGSMETGVTWQWWRTDDVVIDVAALPVAGNDGDRVDWGKIDDAKTDTYTPVSGDIGHGLAAVATYTDPTGTGKSANKHSDNPVIINNDNVGPVFKDDNDDEITETTRKVREDATPNAEADVETTVGINESMQVGDAVMATDDNAADLLTYNLGGPDAALFTVTDDTAGTPIVRGGLLSLKTGVKLNYEDKNTYMVKVTAADPDGEKASVDVTIKVTDVDEPPKITVGGLAISAGPTTPDHAENSTADVGTYNAVGSMKDSASWTLTGDDDSHFMLEGSPGMSVTLKFKNAPDHEMPGDANMDNYYMVTLNAVDSEDNVATPKAVKVRVTNMDEDGMVTFWRDDANGVSQDATTAEIMVGDEITAAAMDPDGNPGDSFPIAMDTAITAATWQWAMHAMPADGSMPADDSTGWMDITGATNAAYTVVDDDDGMYLRATAMYADGEGANKMAMEKTAGVVTPMNAAPAFSMDDETWSVAENTAAGMNIGIPVTATDANGDTLTYALNGADAASFDIDQATGQLMTKAMLDYEMPRGMAMSDDNTNTYMVMVTATDPDGLTDSIDVTIMVTDVNEAPMFAEATAARSIAENSPEGTIVGDPVTAMDDPDGDTLMYALSGNDAMYFTINSSTGQIMVGGTAMLDYESDKMSYMVTVTATDPEDLSDSIDVTITVTDVDENVAPMFAAETATRMVAENSAAGSNVGAPVTATDANGDTLTYTLSGDDDMYFTIDNMGQIMVGENAMLDYEADKNEYMVTVTAADPADLTDSIDVTITVTDVEEVVGNPLVARYDANDNGTIEKSEVITAINDYLFGEGDAAITKPEVIELINLYLFG